MRLGGCWSATSCQTRRGMDTISTLPGGLASGPPAVPDRAGRGAARSPARATAATPASGGAEGGPRHRRPRRSRYSSSVASTSASAPQHPLHRAAPGLGHRRRGRRVGEQREPPRRPAPARRPRARSGRSSPSRTTSGTSPTGVATTGRQQHERLGQHQRAGLPDRGDGHHVGRGQLVRGVVARADQEPRWPSRSLARGSASVSSPASGPSPTMATRTSAPSVHQQRGGLDQRRQPLLRVEPGDADDERLAVARRRGGPAPRRAGAGPRVAGPSGRITRTGREVCCCDVAADLGRHRHQRVGAA